MHYCGGLLLAVLHFVDVNAMKNSAPYVHVYLKYDNSLLGCLCLNLSATQTSIFDTAFPRVSVGYRVGEHFFFIEK